jgi:hypothetical protein
MFTITGYALLVLPCWACFILFHVMLHWFFLADNAKQGRTIVALIERKNNLA